MEQREPRLGVAVGRKGVGKTYTTTKLIDSYVLGNPSIGISPRRVLILDVNDEFGQYRALSLKDVKKFSSHPRVEVRRIRPFNDKGVRMTLNEIADALFKILNDFRGGLLLVEDINRYVSDSLPNDLIGALCTNRHTDTDIIMHFQAIGRITPKIWQNINWLRFHKNTESVEKHKKKFEDKAEMFRLMEDYVELQYESGDERFFCYADIDDMKIKGCAVGQMEKIVENYIEENYNRLIKPKMNNVKFGTSAKKHTAQELMLQAKNKIMDSYIHPKKKL